MSRKVAVIHTSFVSVDHLRQLFREIIPEAEMINLVDDSLLPEVMANGRVTPAIIRRFCAYAREAEALGAELILSQCSSVGEAADIAGRLVSIPLLRIDEAMAEQAVRTGSEIAVVATVASTMEPSTRLVEQAALRLGKPVTVRPVLVDGALDVLMKQGDRPRHNQMVLQAITLVEADCDVIVLAQGSMVVLLPELAQVQKPVLTSPRLAVARVRRMLGLGDL